MGDRSRIFCLGFLTLFLELLFIRFMAGNIWNLGYFPNLVLISAFIGLGAGFISHRLFGQRISDTLFAAVPPLVTLFVCLIYAVSPEVPGFGSEGGDFRGEVFFTASKAGGSSGGLPLFIFWFLFVAAIFFLIAQRTAKVFMRLKPLTAYSYDILGSCCGIAAFIGISFVEAPAHLWFLVAAPLFVAGKDPSFPFRRAAATAAVSMLAAVVLVSIQDGPHGSKNLRSIWSPYQKVDLRHGERIFVNDIDHQGVMEAPQNIFLYAMPHVIRSMQSKPAYEKVLIIGAGAGNDAVTALHFGASGVDAVEIDPAIVRLGEWFAPARPYQSPKVKVFIDDGRRFMASTDKKYDLVVFALTDSLVKMSAVSQLRLESYLFTLQSFKRAWSLVEDGGTLFAVNFYREPWVAWKIAAMMSEVSGREPVVYNSTVLGGNLFAYETMIFADKTDVRPACQDPHPAFICEGFSEFSGRISALVEGVEPPDDNRPFLYIKGRGIPSVYLFSMAGVLCFTALLLALMRFVRRRAKAAAEEGEARPNPAASAAFLLMGAAFLLLETKGIIQFSLLFGNTWLNSSLVFLAVLVLVLAANWVAAVIKSPRLVPAAFVLLLLSCLPALVFPLDALLETENPAARFAAASLMIFLPIFFANIVFSSIFRGQKVHEVYFGWNLVGAVAGGVLEYSSMLLGYQALALIVLVLYAGVFGLYYLRVAGSLRGQARA